MGRGIVVGLVGVVLWAASASAAVNEQDQSQRQYQDQEQYQGQHQAAVGVGVGVGVSEGNTTSADQSVQIEETHPKEKSLAHGSQALFVPQGNEGVAVQTPWGGPMISQGSQMGKLQALHSIAVAGNNAELASQALAWAGEEAAPKRFLGIPRSEKGCRNWLVALFCF